MVLEGGNCIKHYIVNERIRAREVRLIDDQGNQLGIVSIDEARRLASEKGLDLLLISEDAKPPVCKVLDYGQFLYQQKKKGKQQKKSGQVIKELKISHKISIHDYNVRLNQAKKFLQKKFKVKLSVVFKGREIMYRDKLGMETAERFLEDIQEYGSRDDSIGVSGRNLSVLINPK